MVDPVEYVKTWALGYVGQWRSMDAAGRQRFEAALAHFGEVTGEGLDAVAARHALEQIREEVEEARRQAVEAYARAQERQGDPIAEAFADLPPGAGGSHRAAVQPAT